MKLTATQLRKLIRQERTRMLQEQMDPASAGSMAVQRDAYADAQGGLRTFEFTVTLRGDGLDEAEAWIDAVDALAFAPGDPDPTMTRDVT